jgi:hypothetical protein
VAVLCVDRGGGGGGHHPVHTCLAPRLISQLPIRPPRLGAVPELVSAAIRLASTSRSRIVPLNTAKMLHRVSLDPSAAMPGISLLPEDTLELYDAVVVQLGVERAALVAAGSPTAGIDSLLQRVAALDPDVYFAGVRACVCLVHLHKCLRLIRALLRCTLLAIRILSHRLSLTPL